MCYIYFDMAIYVKKICAGRRITSKVCNIQSPYETQPGHLDMKCNARLPNLDYMASILYIWDFETMI